MLFPDNSNNSDDIHNESSNTEGAKDISESNTNLKVKTTENRGGTFYRQQEFQTLVENSPDIIARLNTNLQYMYVNPEFQRIFQLSSENVIGKANNELPLSQNLIKHFENSLREVIRTNTPNNMEITLPTKDGDRIYYSLLTPEYDSNRKIRSILAVARDVTDLKLAEQRKDEFITMASHELKTPLTSIKVFTQILRKFFSENEDQQVFHYLRRMEEQINRLNYLINELLDVSKMQSGKLELNKKVFSIAKMIKEAVENIQTITDTHTIRIDHLDDAKVCADKERINQVLINLIINAIKYSPGAKEVIVRSFFKDKLVKIEVQDFGLGIDKKHEKKIFDRFYRIEEYQDKKRPGLGMGLYIAAQIIQMHNGKISLKSKKGEGSTFTFLLPVN